MTKTSPKSMEPSFVPLMCQWPAQDFVPVCHRTCDVVDAIVYLDRRGITLDVAEHYQIHYSPSTRRVILPILMDGICYGWQGRAIDKVEDCDRIRNNTGFSRGALLMFADELKKRSYAIIAEGPFDAMKFYRVGGAIATMGKVITQNQLQILKKYDIRHAYLALDDDAIPEMRELAEKLGMEAYRVMVPQSCITRCQEGNRKADFGECTFEECIEAIKHAVKLDEKYMMTYWQAPEDVLRASLMRKDKNAK